MNPLKKSIHQALQKQLDTKIETANSAINSAKESRDNETKSSVGDKYETGRAMMQAEQERNEVRLMKANELNDQLGQIDLENNYQRVETGSLVVTSKGTYFICIGIGKVELEGNTYYAISVRSPIGQAMLGKVGGEKFSFQGNEILIKSIF